MLGSLSARATANAVSIPGSATMMTFRGITARRVGFQAKWNASCEGSPIPDHVTRDAPAPKPASRRDSEGAFPADSDTRAVHRPGRWIPPSFQQLNRTDLPKGGPRKRNGPEVPGRWRVADLPSKSSRMTFLNYFHNS